MEKYFKTKNISNDNYDKDRGIDSESFRILEELTLEKVAAKVMTKINHPFGLKNEDLLDESEIPQIKRYVSCQDENLSNMDFWGETSKKKRTKFNDNRSENKKKRFSDLVNNTYNNKYYLSRNKRYNYHGSIVVKAKELEYLFLQKYHKRIANEELFNQNRIIIGNFWIIAKEKERVLAQIRGERPYRKIKNFSKRGQSEYLNFKSSEGKKKLIFGMKENSNQKSSEYKLKTFSKSPFEKEIQPHFLNTPAKEKNLIFSNSGFKNKFSRNSIMSNYNKSSGSFNNKKNSKSHKRELLRAPKKNFNEACRLSLVFDSVSTSSQKLKEERDKRRISDFDFGIDESDLDTRGTFQGCASGKKMKRGSLACGIEEESIEFFGGRKSLIFDHPDY